MTCFQEKKEEFCRNPKFLRHFTTWTFMSLPAEKAAICKSSSKLSTKTPKPHKNFTSCVHFLDLSTNTKTVILNNFTPLPPSKITLDSETLCVSTNKADFYPFISGKCITTAWAIAKIKYIKNTMICLKIDSTRSSLEKWAKDYFDFT